MQVLEGAGGLMSGAELKTGLRNAAAQDGMPAQKMKHSNISVKPIAGEKMSFSMEEVEPWRRHPPDLSSSSSCWGWENPRQPDERADAAMAEECAELRTAPPVGGPVSSAAPLASSLDILSAVCTRCKKMEVSLRIIAAAQG